MAKQTKTRLTSDDIHGAWVIMPTPSTPDASDGRVQHTVDLDETARIVEALIAAGVDGILPAGIVGTLARRRRRQPGDARLPACVAQATEATGAAGARRPRRG